MTGTHMIKENKAKVRNLHG